MGVRRLQTFMEKYCPDASRRVMIEDLAMQYREDTGEVPVLVVDGSSTFKCLYGDRDWICGGQAKEFSECVRDFIKSFEELGIQLVMFFDGHTQEAKRPVWAQRRQTNIKDISIIMGKVEKGCDVSSFTRTYCGIPSVMGTIMAEIAMEQNCKVYQSVMKECDEEIVRYTQKHDCFAIMGQDTDYVIYEGNHLYLSAEHFSLENMSTVFYDRKRLASTLKISTEQLPILATVMGNDIIQAESLKRFHMKHTGRVAGKDYIQVLVHSLASYVRTLPSDKKGVLRDAPYLLSQEMFRTRNRAEDIKKNMENYYKNESLYNTEPNFHYGRWAERLKRAYKNHVENQMPYAFVVMNFHMYELPSAVEDFSEKAMTSGVILRPMRQRMYGVLLKDEPFRENKGVVEEWYVCELTEEPQLSGEHVQASLPPESKPSLKELWFDTPKVSKSARSELLAWIISPHFPCPMLRQLPEQIVGAAAILFYLYNDANILEVWEVHAFAASVVDQQVMSSSELAEIEVPKLWKRGVHLANMFTRAMTHLLIANAICGDPIPRKWVQSFRCFDGRLFQATYSTFKKEGKHTQLKGSELHYDLLCSVVTGE